MVTKFDEQNKQIEITPLTKSETYEYTGNGQGVVNFTIANGAWINTQYSPNWRSFATKAKNGKDLTVNTLFYDEMKLTTKVITTTIKDFFADSSAYSNIKLYQGDTNSGGYETITPDDFEYLYNDKAFTEGDDNVLASSDKGRELVLDTKGNDTVYDTKGDDKYFSENNDYTDGQAKAIYDFDGNDIYQATKNSHTYARDVKGKDEYYVSGNSDYQHTVLDVRDSDGDDKYSANQHATLNVVDIKGKDNYEIKNNSVANIIDAKGNDTYTVGNDTNWMFSKGNIQITDFDGSDTYNFKDALTTLNNPENEIDDESEKSSDTYNIENTAGFTFYDAGGSDKYTITNCTTLDPNDRKANLVFTDNSGSDTWSLTNVKYTEYQSGDDASINDYDGSDKYTFNEVQYLKTYDYGYGSDTYNVVNSNHADIRNAYGNDTYNLKYGTNIKTIDDSGNDKYVISGEEGNLITAVEIYDYDYVTSNKNGTYKRTAGNDSYTVNWADDVYIHDDGGNNKWSISNSSNVELEVCDCGYIGGTDKYEVGPGCKKIEIYEELGGNDTYNFKGTETNWITDAYVEDYNDEYYYNPIPNNDTYNFQYVTTNTWEYSGVEDYDGNDKYTLNNVQGFSIYDTYSNDSELKNCNDKYTVTGGLTSDVSIYDCYGKDNYSVKGTKDSNIYSVSITDDGTRVAEDADKYDLEYVCYATITDEGGNNTFNVKNAYSVTVKTNKMPAGAGVNKYSFTATEGFSVIDSQSQGQYTITSSYGSITDSYGDDTYKLSKLAQGSTVYLADYYGNDKYNVDKLTATLNISDTAGDNDILTIGGNQKDFVFMTNCDKTTGADDACSLIAYDKKNGGYVKINNFFNNSYNGFGNGEIEEIKIGKKVSDDVFTVVETKYNNNALRAQIAGWLADNNYTDVANVLAQNNADDIATITAYFENNAVG